MPENENKKWLRISAAISSIQRSAGLRSKTDEQAGIIARELAGIFSPAGCSVFLIDADETNNLAEAGFPSSGRKVPYSYSMPLMQYLADSPDGILTGGRADIPSAAVLYPETGPESVLCSPILNSPVAGTDSPRGFIYISSAQKDAFAPGDLKLIGHIAGELCVLTELAGLYSRTASLTIRDELTGCFNKKKFDEDIETDIPCAERYGKPLSLLKIDVDFLKLYNESNGRLKGDDIIKKAGETLSYSIRMCDKLYRYSGEEFILILPGIDKERAVFAAGRLRKVLGQFRFEGEEVSQPGGKITFSIGVASFPSDAVYKDGLIKAVDNALLKAKEAGGDAVVSY